MKNEIANEQSLSSGAGLDHPNIVRPIELFTRKRELYLVLQLCSGALPRASLVLRKTRARSRAYFERRKKKDLKKTNASASSRAHTHTIRRRHVQAVAVLRGGRRALRLADHGRGRARSPALWNLVGDSRWGFSLRFFVGDSRREFLEISDSTMCSIDDVRVQWRCETHLDRPD